MGLLLRSEAAGFFGILGVGLWLLGNRLVRLGCGYVSKFALTGFETCQVIGYVAGVEGEAVFADFEDPQRRETPSGDIDCCYVTVDEVRIEFA